LSGTDAAGSAMPAASRAAGPGTARAVALLYLLSGATGLCYEVLWARMLNAQFGLSIFGIAATVASFLLGLGAGALWGAGWRLCGPGAGRSARRALAFYAILELAVALYALALPAVASAGAPLVDAAAARLAWWQWCALQGALALVLLGLPAAAIGASFPLVLRALPWSPALLGRIYALNTAGAAIGALLALGLLAALGWSGALQVVALAGVLVAAGAGLLSRTLPPPVAAAAVSGATDRSVPAAAARAGGAPARAGLLLAYAGAGACALLLEIGWTRLYGMVMLRTEYVLAIILAVYLLGTALGSALAAQARRPLAVAVPLCACACTLLGLWALAPFSAWMQSLRFDSLLSALAWQALALAACTLPTTAALGAWLPALARRFPQGQAGPHAAALLYGANCLGGALGAVLAVVLVIPLVGASGNIALAAVLIVLCGTALGAPRALLAALPVAAAAAWLVHALPPPARLLDGAGADSRVLYQYEDALTLNHVIEMPDGQRVLLTDLQHMDASSEPAAVALQADQARLPLLLHPAARSVLFLGLGTGISASGSLAWPGLQRTAVEISPGAVHAAQTWFAPVNGGVMARLQVAHDDARHFLAAGSGRFDVIVGDLFHPDLAGMSNLLSVEQFQRARERLAAGGVFAQWLALNQFDRESLHTVLRSFQRVFPDAQIFLDGAHLAMVGAAAPRRDADAMRAALRSADSADAATGGEGAATWLGRYWGPIAAGIGPVQSEAQPVIEYRLPHLRYAEAPGSAPLQEASPLADILLELLRQRPDAARAAAQLGVAADEQAAFAGAYAASELAVESWLAVLASDSQRARQLVRLAYEANPQDRWIAADLADDLFEAASADGSIARPGTLERILRIDPRHLASARALWRRERGQPDEGAALARLRALAPLDHEAGSIGVRLP
jgi:spermidine synthase